MVQNLPALPGAITSVGWTPPQKLPFDDWVKYGKALALCNTAVQWWLGDWWAYGEHHYGERAQAAAEGIFGKTFGTLRVYGSVARNVKTLMRINVLSFFHHQIVASLKPRQQKKWLARAVKMKWSAAKLRAALAQAKAIDRTRQIAFDAGVLGLYALILADPPWRYENPPMGGTNRSIENHYPTMTLNEICALPVRDIAHENSILFLWATAPKLAECLEVIRAWGFTYRTNAIWVKDQLGMGYHFRNKHELLLVAKRGELAPPQPENRPESVFEAPRTEHSEKPKISYELIEKMYPDLGKTRIELFQREAREGWPGWGNQIAEAAE